MSVAPILVGLSSSLIFLVLLFKLVQRNRAHHSEFNAKPGDPNSAAWTDEWFEEFSSFRYLPMRRLLSEEEEAYWLASRSDAPANRAAFRAERRRLFREYLALITADFNRLSQGVRLSVVHASVDQSAEIEQLLRLEWSFRKLLWRAQASLMLHWLGVKPTDATELINALQGFEFSLREIRLSAAQS